MYKSIFLVLIILFSFNEINAQHRNIAPDYTKTMDFTRGIGKITSVKYDFVQVYKSDREVRLSVYSDIEKKFVYRSRIAGYNSDNSIYGNPFAFEYKGRSYVLVYTKFHTSAWSNDGNRWLRLYRAEDESLKKWHEYEISTRASKDHRVKYYKCAYTYGDYVYFAYDVVLIYKENNDEIKYYKHEIRIDKCKIEDGRIHVYETFEFKNMMNSKYFHPIALDGFKHPDGFLRLIVSYSAEDNFSLSNHGGGVVVLNLNPHKLTHNHLHTWGTGDMASVRAFFGSLKGKQREASGNSAQKKNPLRIQVLSDKYDENTQWTKFYYRTYSIEANDYKLCGEGTIEQHKKMLSRYYDGIIMDAATKLTSKNMQDKDVGNNGVEQTIWLFHFNSEYDVYANVFKSDIWKSNPNTVETSSDLMNDKKYGKQIRELWTLVGITDGSPPVSMNWTTWNTVHPHNNVFPTSLKFSTASTESSKISQSSDHGFYTKTGAKIAHSFGSVGVSFSGSFKYASHQIHTTSLENIISKEITIEFNQSDSSQDLAYLIWSIPDIRRIEYALYPWWDTDLTNSQDSSSAFLFYSPGFTLKKENVPISQLPFKIKNPNDSTMSEWLNRDTLNMEAGFFNIAPMSFSWTSPTSGSTVSLLNSSIKTNSHSTTHNYSIDFSVGISVPDVFKLTSTIGFNWKYTNTSSTSSRISTGETVSMANLTSTYDGSKVPSISTNAYFFHTKTISFTPIPVSYWYYKYFGKHRPWYIAYEVTSISPIKVAKPYANDVVRKIPTFSWTHKDQTDFDYTVLFSTDFSFDMNTIELASGKQKFIEIPNDLANKFPNDSVIYWVVKGKNSEGKYSWSKTHWFVISKDKDYAQSETGMDKLLLDFVIFPNPIQEKQTNILIKSGIDSEKMSLEVFSLDGRLVYRKDIHSNMFDGSKLRLDLSMLSSGYYTVKLESDSHLGVGKIVVP